MDTNTWTQKDTTINLKVQYLTERALNGDKNTFTGFSIVHSSVPATIRSDLTA